MASAEAGPAPAGLEDLERTRQKLEIPLGARAELIDGEVIVSPGGAVRHSSSVDELMDQLFEVKCGRGWRFHTYLTMHIPATQEHLVPDLIVAEKHAPQLDDNELLASGILLVAEVVSAWSRRRDTELKPQVYSDGGIPLYLVIDTLANPPSVILHIRPGSNGYARRQIATAGQPLQLPEPFGITLDTARLLG